MKVRDQNYVKRKKKKQRKKQNRKTQTFLCDRTKQTVEMRRQTT